MRINNNIPALNTHRLLDSNTSKLSKSLERLSSGKRINRAADDAAGMAISEKMNAQIRGLRQASRNSLDGISLVQTAEGALNEMNEMLQRIRELAVQAANGTYQDDDRLAIQNEIMQLIEELNSISNQTQFNGIYLLNGNTAVKDEIAGGSSLEAILGSGKITNTGGITNTYEYSGITYASAVIDFSNISSGNISKLNGQGIHYTCCTCDKAYSIRFVSGDPNTSYLNDTNPIMEVDIRNITNGQELAKRINETAYGKEYTYIPGTNKIPIKGESGQPNAIPSGATSFVNHYSQIAASGSQLYIYDNRSSYANSNWPSNGRGIFQATVYTGKEEEPDKAFLLDIQVGANEGEKISIKIPNVDPEHLEIRDQLSVLTQEDANLAISQTDRAIKRILQTRSRLGAYQNRLEHTIANVDNTAENLQESVSRIADLDMALEMSEFTKLDILQQAGTSMLSQANNMPQTVLRLLQS